MSELTSTSSSVPSPAAKASSARATFSLFARTHLMQIVFWPWAHAASNDSCHPGGSLSETSANRVAGKGVVLDAGATGVVEAEKVER